MVLAEVDLRGQGVHDDQADTAVSQHRGRRQGLLGEHRREHQDDRACRHVEPHPGRVDACSLAWDDAGQRVQQPAEVPAPGTGAHGVEGGRAEHPKAHPVTAPEMVLGNGARRADRDVEAARPAGGTAAASEVDTAVDQEQQAAVLLATVLVTCSVPVRSDTRHCTRRSRSPGANGRMLASSLPSPGRRAGWVPTNPIGCGAGARLSKVSGIGSVVRAAGVASTGPQKWPPQRLVAPTSPSPRTRRPHRRLAKGTSTVTWSAGTGAEVPTTPLAGLAAHHRCRVSTTTACSTSTASDRRVRDTVPSPSRIVVCISALCGSGCIAGGRASAITACTSNGTASTKRSGRPNATASRMPSVDTSAARIRAPVRRHP